VSPSSRPPIPSSAAGTPTRATSHRTRSPRRPDELPDTTRAVGRLAVAAQSRCRGSAAQACLPASLPCPWNRIEHNDTTERIHRSDPLRQSRHANLEMMRLNGSASVDDSPRILPMKSLAGSGYRPARLGRVDFTRTQLRQSGPPRRWRTSALNRYAPRLRQIDSAICGSATRRFRGESTTARTLARRAAELSCRRPTSG